MRTNVIPTDFQHISPAGAEVRPLMENKMGGIAHCTLRMGKTSRVVVHKTVSEFWHVISGEGEIWRRQEGTESVTTLKQGITIDIPVGTRFQYRSTQNSDLTFICITMPPWPGSNEVDYCEKGAWAPAP